MDRTQSVSRADLRIFFLPDDKYGAFFQIFGPITNVIQWDGLSRHSFIIFFVVSRIFLRL